MPELPEGKAGAPTPNRTAGLVGAESSLANAGGEQAVGVLQGRLPLHVVHHRHGAVSYTHLTLPTICSV
eukprot:1012649-Alexandrium_andersonii.AAC.1